MRWIISAFVAATVALLGGHEAAAQPRCVTQGSIPCYPAVPNPIGTDQILITTTTMGVSTGSTGHISLSQITGGGGGTAGVTSLGGATGAISLGSGLSMASNVLSATVVGTGGGTVTSITAGTGLSGGTITTAGTISMPNVNSTPGTYTNATVTLDAQGRVTSASNGTGGGGGGVTSFGGATGAILVGSGLSMSGQTLNATGGGGGGGTVTSVGMTVPPFMSVAPATITTTGTFAVTLSGTALPVTSGGTGLTTLTGNTIYKGNGTTAMAVSSMSDANSGVTVGAPTGGGQGFGTLNATGLFVNGVAVAGGVSTTGTPVAGQFAQFTAPSVVQGVSTVPSTAISGSNRSSAVAPTIATTDMGNQVNLTNGSALTAVLPAKATNLWQPGQSMVMTSQGAAITLTNSTTLTPAGTGNCGSIVAGSAILLAANNDGTHLDCQPLGNVSLIAAGATAMGTSAIASGACAAAITVSAAGVITTDVITATFSADPTSTTGFIPSTSGMLTIITYPTANNVNFKECNNTSASVTPGAHTLNWRVAR